MSIACGSAGRKNRTSALVPAYSREIHPQFLPAFDEEVEELALEAAGRFPYGARSAAAVYVGDLLCEHVPAVSPSTGNLDIVAIARRPGVLSKVALRPRRRAPTPLVIGLGADQVATVRELLDGERVHVVAWQRSASAYISHALGLGEEPPMLLLHGIAHARVLLGEIDLRGIAGWRGLNAMLASALTGWRIRLEPIAGTVAWRRLRAAMQARRSVPATVVGRTDRGVRVELLGLYALLSGSGALREWFPGEDVEVRITRMDPDEGRIFVSDRLAATGQLGLPLADSAAEGAGRSSSTGRD
jgi:transcription antitermination factor NusA-like protein